MHAKDKHKAGENAAHRRDRTPYIPKYMRCTKKTRGGGLTNQRLNGTGGCTPWGETPSP